jgi:hemolysin III
MKWRLRRFDHSAIYILIAAMRPGALVITFLIGVWFLAALGAAIKFALPGRLDRLSIAVYLAMGWSGVILLSDKNALLPSVAFDLLTAGGVLLSIGLIFHIWQKLRFQNAIWHFFVLLGITTITPPCSTRC